MSRSVNLCHNTEANIKSSIYIDTLSGQPYTFVQGAIFANTALYNVSQPITKHTPPVVPSSPENGLPAKKNNPQEIASPQAFYQKTHCDFCL
jgi:hypothetical protein